MSKKKNLIVLFGAILVLGVVFIWVISKSAHAPSVDNFAECAEEYPVLKTDPPQCKTPDGRTFTKDTDEELPNDDKDKNITSFSECKKHYPVMESYPPRCKTDSGKTFTEPNCQAGTGTDIAVLTISDAREIAKESECGDRLLNSYQCNEASGTWWIDLDIEKEGCMPACVVDVENREAKINWRCTGFTPESEQP